MNNNDTSPEDEKQELKNVFHSVKKFTLRYVLFVSTFRSH